MKRGLIVYLTGSDSLPATFEPDSALAHLPLSCDRAVLAASGEGFCGVDEALHLLLVNGMQHVSCIKARLGESGSIEFFGEPLRLYG
jgi:hypothetical protein